MEEKIAELMKNCSCYIFFKKDGLCIYGKNMEIIGIFAVDEEQKAKIRKTYVGLESQCGR